jgi:outer membrane protein assembly factor BamB
MAAAVAEDIGPPVEEKLFALSAATGEVEWISALPGRTVHHLPVAFTEKTVAVSLFAVPWQYKVSAFARDGGKLLWQAPGHRILARPLGCRDKVVMCDGSENVWALAQDDGRMLWRYALPGVIANRNPASSEERLLLTWAATHVSGVGGVDCIDARTGAFLWRYTVREAVSYLRVAVGDAHAYVGQVSGDKSRAGTSERGLRVACLSTCDGEAVWEGAYPSADLLVEARGRLFGFAGTSGVDEKWCLWAADARTGALQRVVRGRTGFGLAVSSIQQPVVVAGSFLILGEKPGRGSEQRKAVICVDLVSGEVLQPWTYITSSSEGRGGPIGGVSRAYFREDDTHLVAIEVK